MSVTYERKETVNDIPPEVAAYAIAIDESIALEVALPSDPGDSCTIRLSLSFSKAHESRSATEPYQYMFSDDEQSGWEWVAIGTLDDTNDVARDFIKDQEARYPGLIIVGP